MGLNGKIWTVSRAVRFENGKIVEQFDLSHESKQQLMVKLEDLPRIPSIMNNDISENYCSYEACELLHVAGFDVDIQTRLVKDDPQIYMYGYDEVGGPGEFIKCPTHNLALAWILENFGKNIYVTSCIVDNNVVYTGTIETTNQSEIILEIGTYLSHSRAIDAAICYVLKNK